MAHSIFNFLNSKIHLRIISRNSKSTEDFPTGEVVKYTEESLQSQQELHPEIFEKERALTEAENEHLPETSGLPQRAVDCAPAVDDKPLPLTQLFT